MTKTIDSDVKITKRNGKYVYRVKGKTPMRFDDMGELIKHIDENYNPERMSSASYGSGLSNPERVVIAGVIGSVLDRKFGGD